MQRFIIVLIWLFPLALAGILVGNYLGWSGQKTVHLTANENSPFVQRLLPDERVTVVYDARGLAAELLDEPVYFSVTPPPGNFTNVELRVALDPGTQEVIELGGLKNVAAQAFDFVPLATPFVTNLGWGMVEYQNEAGEDIAVYARRNDVASIGDFMSDLPARDTVAVYRATFPAPYRMAGYTPLDQTQRFVVSLRGTHEALTYLKKENLQFTFVYHDLNRTYGRDDGYVRVYNETGELMTEVAFLDDGNDSEDQRYTQREITVRGSGWAEGVYRLELSGTSDTMWRQIATSQKYFVLKNKVYIGDEVGVSSAPRSTVLYTAAKRLTFETAHAEGIQEVRLGSSRTAVAAAGEKYTLQVAEPGLLALNSPVGDVKVTGEGKYALSEASYFNPDPAVLSPFIDLDALGINYIIARQPVVAVSFPLADLADEFGAKKFALSAPGVTADDHVRISRITATFTKEPSSPVTSMHQLARLVKKLLP